MLLMVTKAEQTLGKYDGLAGSSRLARLVQPRHWDGMTMTVERGRAWAADNDCFQGLDAFAYKKMLLGLPVAGCRFVTVPDVVGDHAATLRLWRQWSPYVISLGFPAAFVLQDGCEGFGDVPETAGAVFVGGSTVFKLSQPAAKIVRDARREGLWVHMGRVSTQRRIIYAQSIGCDSFDSSAFSKWSDRDIPWALRMLDSGAYQQSLLSEVSA